MMKKLWLGILIGLGVLIAACVQQATEEQPTTTQSAEVIELHLAFAIPIDSNQGIFAQKFAELVEQKSNGRVRVILHPAGELGGSETAYIEAMQAGTLDMAAMAAAPVSQFSNALIPFDVPFLFAKQEDVLAYRDSDLAQQRFKELEGVGLKLLALHTFAPRGLFTRVPVDEPEDIAGLKLRTMKNKLHVDGFEALGVTVVTMPFGEVYTALQTGTIDGNNDDAVNYIKAKFYEVAPYWYDINFVYNTLVLLMSKSKFDSLPPDVQNILIEAAKEAADWEIEYYNSLIEKTIQEEFSELGIKYTPCPEDQWRELQKKTLIKILPKYKDVIGLDTLEWVAKRDPQVKEILEELGYT